MPPEGENPGSDRERGHDREGNRVEPDPLQNQRLGEPIPDQAGDQRTEQRIQGEACAQRDEGHAHAAWHTRDLRRSMHRYHR